MKQVNLRICRMILPLLMGMFLSLSSFAQEVTVKGHVKDVTGEPVIGANVVVKGTSIGTITDFDGNFVLNAPQNSILEITFIGYKPMEVQAAPSITVTMEDDAILLDEAVIIGYGVVKKSDATGSITAIKIDEDNTGVVINPQDMLAGKVAGVSVISSGGQPGAGSTIRIRGGSSLTASNDPLVVIDGVVMSNGGVDGLSNPLSLVAPSDIETFTVLKDASATAIYGSRASNGVILITTKKGTSDKVRFSYSGNVTVSSKRNTIDVMSASEYRDYITNASTTTEAMLAALNLYPNASTDWQDEVLRTAVSTDHNLSVFGSVKNAIPFRLSVGYTNQNGILKTSNFERFTESISFTPSLFDGYLNMNLNGKLVFIKNKFADTGAIGGAASFDPTKPVMNDNTKFKGYYTWTGDNTPNGTKSSSAAVNPVALLELKDDRSTVTSFVGNAQFDYKLHFFPDIKLNLNLAIDYSTSNGSVTVDPESPESYSEDAQRSGYSRVYSSTRNNQLLEFYGQYTKDFYNNHFDVMAGYSYQSYLTKSESGSWHSSRAAGSNGERTDVREEWNPNERKYVLLSFYGRMNYSLLNRYLLTFTLRDDASSRFHKDHRWGLFPSVALGWKIKEEAFMNGLDKLNELKLRLGWGITGQQDLNISNQDYAYMSFYRSGKGGAMYPFYDESGNVRWVNVIAPTAFTPDLKWEQTTTYNIGLDYGILNNRINGSLDFYLRKTKDLINAEVNVPAGTDFAEFVVSNIGSLENKGVEFSINAKPIVGKNWNWDVGFNIAYNKTKITELTYNDNSDSMGRKFESAGGLGGYTIKIHSVGKAPGMYYVYQQVYDDNGKPIEGEYVDRNGDGIISDKDLYRYKKPDADVLMGFNSKLSYKNFDFGFNGRVSLGNYNCNTHQSGAALAVNEVFGNNALANKPKSALVTGFQERQRLSDYFIQNASFLKIDNITLGYNIPKFFLTNSNARFYATVQNPIVITKYDGIDPEVSNGMDDNVYPRPLTFLFGVNINF